ncbi:pyrroline-5-carboxylate reductase ProC [Clostridium aceticum]|uniref:Pyrroline-5-carboxylate reductase n=1 Tax=Clostridium aceticum TaxID=84022 RepID=A0A0D8ID26_9CLOT|nr:pyrroline-5-carboxylate reductase [Clostridium aceticum]AKL95949.1 pyrroline-5-carboxylate reductase ProC [Clostridium aceticum]KJF27101.1 pyrroline-5-carboxylate reductase [Clostridium aceticum]
MSKKKLGFIGCGNMSGAILDGIVDSGVLEASAMIVFDINEKAKNHAREKGVEIAADLAEVCSTSEMILLGVKPNITKAVLNEIGQYLDGKPLISIVAGISGDTLSQWANANIRVLRTMPNAPAMVGAGATVFCSDTTFTEEEKREAEKIFESVGIVEWVPEKLIDAVTGLSGGGPAYAAMFIEALTDGAVLEGLPRVTAYRLAAQTVLGAAKMILDTEIHPGALKDMVCSPGGTTIEGVKALEDGGMRSAVIQSILSSSNKSRNLGKLIEK